MRKQINFKGMKMTSVLSLEGLKLAFEEQLDEFIKTTAQTSILERKIKAAGIDYRWYQDHDMSAGFIIGNYWISWEPELNAYTIVNAGAKTVGIYQYVYDAIAFIQMLTEAKK